MSKITLLLINFSSLIFRHGYPKHIAVSALIQNLALMERRQEQGGETRKDRKQLHLWKMWSQFGEQNVARSTFKGLFLLVVVGGRVHQWGCEWEVRGFVQTGWMASSGLRFSTRGRIQCLVTAPFDIFAGVCSSAEVDTKTWDCSPDVEGRIWLALCGKHWHMLQIEKQPLLFFHNGRCYC